MTIQQFQELYYIAQSTDFDLDKSIKMVGAVTGKTPEQVELMPIDKFNKLCARVTKEFEVLDKRLYKTKPKSLILASGRLYKINYEINKPPINAGKYVEVITFGKEVIPNLHRIMASIVTPVKWRLGKLIPYELDHWEIARDMERMSFEAAYHAAVFFYTHYSVSMKLIQPFLIKELMKKGVAREKAEEVLSSSSSILDGFTTPKWSQTLKTYLLNRFGN